MTMALQSSSTSETLLRPLNSLFPCEEDIAWDAQYYPIEALTAKRASMRGDALMNQFLLKNNLKNLHLRENLNRSKS
jgi:hypothetical protein